MTRRMSCSMTVDAVLDRTKTVTRRHVDTWTTLKPGDHLTLIEKGMGLPKGAKQRLLAEVEVVSVRLEPLALSILPGELAREGLGHLTHREFVDLWARSHGYRHITDPLARLAIPCRRIEWRYLYLVGDTRDLTAGIPDGSVPLALFADHPPQSLDKDERYTPRWVFDGLGITFDTDPASPGEGAGDCVPAARKITRAENGLTAEWTGIVWLNPPFSNATAWARRFVAHGSGVFLGPISNAAWSHELMSAADLIWLCRDFAFTHPTHAGKRSSMPLFMAAIGAESATALARLARSTSHPGLLVASVDQERL